MKGLNSVFLPVHFAVSPVRRHFFHSVILRGLLLFPTQRKISFILTNYHNLVYMTFSLFKSTKDDFDYVNSDFPCRRPSMVVAWMAAAMMAVISIQRHTA